MTSKEKISTKDRKKEDLIQIAVKFLMSSAVTNASHDAKVNFLKQKGLKDEDIKKAFDLVQDEKEKLEKEEQKKIQQQTKQFNTIKASSLSQEELQEKINRAQTANILTLRNLSLKDIPSEVFTLLNLQVLIISFNNLTFIPDEIQALKNLKILHAVGCNLYDDQISNNLWQINSLVELNLSRNNITNIDQVTELQNLQILDVSSNSIFTLPIQISNLSQLKYLNLRHNNLSRIPSTMKSLIHLKKLFLQDNLLDAKYDDVIRKQYENPKEILEQMEDQLETPI